MVAPALPRIRKNKSEEVLRTFLGGRVRDFAALVKLENTTGRPPGVPPIDSGG